MKFAIHTLILVIGLMVVGIAQDVPLAKSTNLPMTIDSASLEAASKEQPSFVPASRVEQLEIEKYILLIENAQARIQIAQRDIQSSTIAANLLIEQMRAGYKLDSTYVFDQNHRDANNNLQMGFTKNKTEGAAK